MRLFFAVLVFCSLATPVEAQCVTSAPAPGWVCLNGGWLPPGHPLLNQPAPPVEPPTITPPTGLQAFWPPTTDISDPINGPILRSGAHGEALPPGDVYFSPPLRLTGIGLKGTVGRTVLRPLTTSGQLVVVESILPGNPETGYPLKIVISDLTIVCKSRGQVGFDVRGANIVFERVTFNGCGEGVRVTWGVNVTFRDCDWLWNTTGLVLAGSSYSSVTTVRVVNSMFGGHSNAAVVIWNGLGVTFDNTIIEFNSGAGMQILPQGRPEAVDVQLHSVWFEQNAGGHLYDPSRRSTSTGSTSGRE